MSILINGSSLDTLFLKKILSNYQILQNNIDEFHSIPQELENNVLLLQTKYYNAELRILQQLYDSQYGDLIDDDSIELIEALIVIIDENLVSTINF